jgi:hypothetical protein
LLLRRKCGVIVDRLALTKLCDFAGTGQIHGDRVFPGIRRFRRFVNFCPCFVGAGGNLFNLLVTGAGVKYLSIQIKKFV